MSRERFRSVGALAPQGGWKSELALDLERSPPRPVVLAAVPSEVTSDGVTLASLLRASELATRLNHPAVLPVLGLVERGAGMALATTYRSGLSLLDLLAAGGPLAPPLAVRVAGEVARALEAVHGLTPASERPLVHGAVGPETVLVGPGGEVLLAGLGRPSAAGPADDVAALLRLIDGLYPEQPAELTAALEGVGGPSAAAGAIWRALEAAVTPAEPAQLSLWLERMAPEALAAARGEARRVEAALVDEAGPAVDEAATAQDGAALDATPPRMTPPPRPLAPTMTPAPVARHAAPAPTGDSVPPGVALTAPLAAPESPGPDWFAPPTASPPPLKGAQPAAVQAKGTPPPVLHRAGPAAPSGAPSAAAGPAPVPVPPRAVPAPSVAAAPPVPPRPVGAGRPPTAGLLGRLGEEPLRPVIVAAAAICGLLIGYLGGR